MSYSDAESKFQRAVSLVTDDGSTRGGFAVLDNDNPALASTDFPLGTIGVASTGARYVLQPVPGVVPPLLAWFPLSPVERFGLLVLTFTSFNDGQTKVFTVQQDALAFGYRLAGVLTEGTNAADTFTLEVGAAAPYTTIATVSTNVAAGTGVTLSGATGVDLGSEIDFANPLRVTWTPAVPTTTSPRIMVMLAPLYTEVG